MAGGDPWGSTDDADAAAEACRDDPTAVAWAAFVDALEPHHQALRHPRLSFGSADAPRRRYCWTSITGLPSGSVIGARVGPPGMSKGSEMTVPPSSAALAIEARMSRTWM